MEKIKFYPHLISGDMLTADYLAVSTAKNIFNMFKCKMINDYTILIDKKYSQSILNAYSFSKRLKN